MVDLKWRIPLAERLTRGLHWGRDINNSGQIVVGYDRSTRYGTVRLTPMEAGTAPAANPTVSPSVLTPPDGRMVSVSVDPHVTDAFDPEPVCRISSVTNSEHSSPEPDADVQKRPCVGTGFASGSGAHRV